MAKKIVTKSMARNLSKSLLGCLVLIGLLCYQFFNENKTVEPGERFEVELVQCVDGDTAWFNVDGEKTKVRFLYIDTPESTNEIEPYGHEAADFTYEQLTNASKIELELNKDGDSYDKYDRMLAWVFCDDELLQEKLCQVGLVEKFYDYDVEYTYKKVLLKAQEEAKAKQVGIYSN